MGATFVKIRFDISDPAGWENARRWLKGQRLRMRLTQAAVAERIGTTQSEISRFERGLTDPYISTVARYVRALDLAADFDLVEPRADA